MAKSLIIAEKPSVAQDIVRALTPEAGKFEKHADHFENERYVVTSAVGHLVEIKAPEAYDVKRGKWSFAHLPVVPPHFDLAPIDKIEVAPQRGGQAGQAQGRDRADQRLRRRARRRADLPPHRAVRRGRQAARQAGAAPVAAEHDAAGDPRRLRRAAQRQADARPGRRRAQPLRGRLAGRHQRHARDDRVQLARRRLLPHHRGPRADAHAVDRGRARGEDPQARAARLLGGEGGVPRQGRHLRGQVVRSQVEEDRPRRRSADPDRARADRLWNEADARAIEQAVRGQTGPRQRREQAQHAVEPAAVRPDHVAARGQRPLRLLGQDHAVAGAGAVREAQGAHLPAHRLARAARGLPERREEDDGGAGRRRPAGTAARAGQTRQAGAQGRLRQADEACVRQRQGVGPLRDHPDAADAHAPERGRGQAVRPGGQALHRGVLPAAPSTW